MDARRRRIALALTMLLAWTAPGDAAEPEPITPEAKARYWIDRLVVGPEETTWAIPNFHQVVLQDADRNLAALGPVALERFADAPLRERVQANRDANAWHSFLSVLVAIGSARPDVARAWAAPALRHDLLTLRRAALPVIAALKDPADGPLLIEVLRRDAMDRVLGPATTQALLRLGAPWDAAAVRVLFEKAAVDQPDGTSALWTSWPSVAASGPGVRDDVLAWWALLSETAGPHAQLPTGGASRVGRPREVGSLLVVPLPEALQSGRMAAAGARARLAVSGHAPAKAAVEEDRTSNDAALARVAERAKAAPAADVLAALRARGALLLRDLRAKGRVDPAAVKEIVVGLRDDASGDATLLVGDLLRAIPTEPAWREPLVVTYEALVARGQEDGAFGEGQIRSGTPEGLDLALYLARQTKSRVLLEALERWHEEPASLQIRPRLRREIAFLYGYWTPRGGIPPERVQAFATRFDEWIRDPADPSGPALAGALTDLGAPGDAAIASGLRGPARTIYLGAIRQRPSRYLAADVTAALLEPLGAATSQAELRVFLEAALLVAGSDALPAIEALASRVPPALRRDVEVVAAIVRWRVSAS